MSAKYSDLSGYFQYKGRQFADRCTNCGLCLEDCPVFPLTGAAKAGPKTAITKVTDLLKGGEASDEAYEVVFSCNRGCGLCAKACPEGLMPYYLGFIPAAARLIEAGMPLPPLTYQHLPGERYNSGRFLSALQMKPSEARWMTSPPEEPQPAEIVFFTGCAPLGLPHALLETMDILESMGIGFAALAGGDLCCGMAATLWGDLNAAQRLGQELVSAIAAFRPKKAVFFCSGCYVMCLGTLPRFVAVPFQPYELTQFLLENVDKIPFNKTVDKRVALHDSCHSARLGAVDAPRHLLQAVPGIKLVEMAHHGVDALCCGGYTNSVRPDISEAVRRAPMNEAEAAGADVLATMCAGCHESFAPLEAGYSFQVRNFISLLAESIGVQREDKFKRYMRLASVPRIIVEARECLDGGDYTVDEVERVLPDYLKRFCPGHGLVR